MIVDTHVLVWLLEGDPRLGQKARQALDRAVQHGAILVSAITPWEIAMLVHKGRLALGRDAGQWIDEAMNLPGIALVPLEPAIAVDSVRLPGEMHADPADRFIVASARSRGVSLMTADRALLAYGAGGHVAVVDAAV
jgi:PIN domain nuclease of toxin-antitoxin system